MGEHDGRVPVLPDLGHRRFGLRDQRFDVLVSDERSEIAAELRLLTPQAGDFAQSRMQQVALPQKTHRIGQESPLLLPRKLGHLFGPGHQFEVLVVVAQPHERTEKFEIVFAEFVPFAAQQMLQFDQVARSQPGKGTNFLRIALPTAFELRTNLFIGQPGYDHLLRS